MKQQEKQQKNNNNMETTLFPAESAYMLSSVWVWTMQLSQQLLSRNISIYILVVYEAVYI